MTENGYATRGGAGEDRQAADLTATLDALARCSGTLGITDYRYFNLRDNRSTGPDLFDAVGLLFDDYREKAAFAAFRGAVAAHGAPRRRRRTPRPGAARRGLRVTVRPRTVVRGRRTLLRIRVRQRRPASTARLYGWEGGARGPVAPGARGCATASSAGRAGGSYA